MSDVRDLYTALAANLPLAAREYIVDLAEKPRKARRTEMVGDWIERLPTTELCGVLCGLSNLEPGSVEHLVRAELERRVPRVLRSTPGRPVPGMSGYSPSQVTVYSWMVDAPGLGYYMDEIIARFGESVPRLREVVQSLIDSGWIGTRTVGDEIVFYAKV